ncbi:MAG: hypothetical protein K9K66_06805 [Desulfarculaceae bacterium]|nr:hypothetical protein [Desulfarculaceae bacterium]MCF8071799.1 hypothetical protein [Desulfarculaceae bacterium]MCF8101349.1 hypothetical protein [Desulfarculaceae bacterium]MCF8117190.1 hypothetical protein [Desulfarculaceae bacterium]
MPPLVVLREGGTARNVGLRLGLSLSLITGRGLSLQGLVDDSLKPRPGLGPGGLTLAMAASAVSKGRVKGEIGSGELEFMPGGLPQPGDYHFDVAQLQPSPAPYSPIFEMLTLPLAVAPGRSNVILRGASHSAIAPTSDEIASVLLPAMRALGMDLAYSEISPGFFPVGGGEAELTVRPATMLKALKAEDAFRPLRVGVEVMTSGLPVHMAEQAMQGAVDRLAIHGFEAVGNLRRARGGKGQALLVWASDGVLRVGFSTLGKRGERPEALALEAVEALMHFLKSGAALPSGQAARLLLSLACASGVSLFTASGPPKPLAAAAGVINTFWPGTVRLSQPRDLAPLEVRVSGRDWGRAL